MPNKPSLKLDRTETCVYVHADQLPPLRLHSSPFVSLFGYQRPSKCLSSLYTHTHTHWKCHDISVRFQQFFQLEFWKQQGRMICQHFWVMCDVFSDGRCKKGQEKYNKTKWPMLVEKLTAFYIHLGGDVHVPIVATFRVLPQQTKNLTLKIHQHRQQIADNMFGFRAFWARAWSLMRTARKTAPSTA